MCVSNPAVILGLLFGWELSLDGLIYSNAKGGGEGNTHDITCSNTADILDPLAHIDHCEVFSSVSLILKRVFLIK